MNKANDIGHRVDRVLSFLSSRPNLDPPPPNPQSIVSLPPFGSTLPYLSPLQPYLLADFSSNPAKTTLHWSRSSATVSWFEHRNVNIYLPGAIELLTPSHCPLRSGINRLFLKNGKARRVPVVPNYSLFFTANLLFFFSFFCKSVKCI